MHVLKSLQNKINRIRKDLSIHNSQEGLDLIIKIEEEMANYLDRDDVEVIDMSYRCDSEGLKARLVWQRMFDWYRAVNEDLSDMDSLLCDYGRLIRAFKAGDSFCLYFWFNGSATHLLDWVEDCPFMTIFYNGRNHIYIENNTNVEKC